MKTFYRLEVAKLIIYLCFFGACDNPFSYSPFEAAVPADLQNTTEKNLRKIAALDTLASGEFKVALLADPHYHFDDLKDALDVIDQKNNVVFIIVAGDFTENGLQKEFELFQRIMSGAHQPYVTVIGNHDHLSNGALVYQKMFGPLNYSFTFQDVKFVMWDNVLWESNQIPDWSWLRNTLAETSDSGLNSERRLQTIPVSHIPPFDGQLADSAQSLHKLFHDNNVKLSIHGHKHEYSFLELYGDSINYVTVGSPQNRAYAELTVSAGKLKVEKIEY